MDYALIIWLETTDPNGRPKKVENIRVTGLADRKYCERWKAGLSVETPFFNPGDVISKGDKFTFECIAIRKKRTATR